MRVAGRLMAVRGHGKASFTVVSDLSGKIQAYFRLVPAKGNLLLRFALPAE